MSDVFPKYELTVFEDESQPDSGTSHGTSLVHFLGHIARNHCTNSRSDRM